MKTARALAGAIAVCGGMVLLSACSVLAPQPDKTKFFVLNSIGSGSGSATASAGSTSALTIGVGPITLPQYLRRPEVVIRVSPSEIELSNTDRWAEPIESAFARVLSENLSQILGTRQVITFPWYNSAQIDYAVQVNVMRFETDPKGKPELDAQWTIRDARSGKILAGRDSDLTGAAEPSPSAGLSQTLGSLSQEIASEISRLNQQHKNG
jgi:uncharacterized lipoprotein YmbA